MHHRRRDEGMCWWYLWLVHQGFRGIALVYSDPWYFPLICTMAGIPPFLSQGDCGKSCADSENFPEQSLFLLSKFLFHGVNWKSIFFQFDKIFLFEICNGWTQPKSLILRVCKMIISGSVVKKLKYWTCSIFLYKILYQINWILKFSCQYFR